jgi:hypothetical protein
MKKKHNMEVTPIMGLSIMAIFAMMIPIYTIAGADQKTNTTKASQQMVLEATPTMSPTPTSTPKLMYNNK